MVEEEKDSRQSLSLTHSFMFLSFYIWCHGLIVCKRQALKMKHFTLIFLIFDDAWKEKHFLIPACFFLFALHSSCFYALANFCFFPLKLCPSTPFIISLTCPCSSLSLLTSLLLLLPRLCYHLLPHLHFFCSLSIVLFFVGVSGNN